MALIQYCVDLTRLTEQPEGQCLFAEVPFGKVSRRKYSASWLVSNWPKMPRGATERHVLSFRRSYSSEGERGPTNSEVSGQNPDRGVFKSVDLQLRTRTGPRLWWSVGVSVLVSAAAMTAVGCFCALTYPIFKGMRGSAHVKAGVIFTQVKFQGTF